MTTPTTTRIIEHTDKFLYTKIEHTDRDAVVPAENYYNIMIKGKTKQFHIHNLETWKLVRYDNILQIFPTNTRTMWVNITNTYIKLCKTCNVSVQIQNRDTMMMELIVRFCQYPHHIISLSLTCAALVLLCMFLRCAVPLPTSSCISCTTI